MHDAERIYQIHRILQGTREPLSAQQLADRLEVSSRTIKREIAFMRDRLGAPIENDPASRGYLYPTQRESFELPGLWFRADELHALLAASQLLESVQPGLLSDHLRPLRQRIDQLLEKSGHSGDAVASRVSVKHTQRRVVEPRHFGVVAGALLNGTPLAIRYHGRDKDQISERTIHPYRLLHYRDNWYLIAWCEKADALRNFAVERITRAATLTTPLRQIDPDQLNNHVDRAFGIFTGQPAHTARLRFNATRARWIADEIWHPDQKGEWQGDHYLLTLPYADPTELLLEIMRFGADVEVLSPPELRHLIAQRHRQAAGLYTDGE
jgi:predicted DNA-binding transcriptional regulator YafY